MIHPLDEVGKDESSGREGLGVLNLLGPLSLLSWMMIMAVTCGSKSEQNEVASRSNDEEIDWPQSTEEGNGAV